MDCDWNWLLGNVEPNTQQTAMHYKRVMKKVSALLLITYRGGWLALRVLLFPYLKVFKILHRKYSNTYDKNEEPICINKIIILY